MVLLNTQPSLKFNCDKCGACCRTKNCSYLTKDNLCSIYDERPNECRVDYLFEVMKLPEKMRDRFYRNHKKMCEFLRKAEKEEK